MSFQFVKNIEKAQTQFRDLMTNVDQQGGLSLDQYVRFLSLQYHLTQGVQRHFMTAASHPDFSSRRKLRNFFYQFANEEELHYLVAKRDLDQLGQAPLPCPLDVKLWKAYFESILIERPFIRLGAACILENIAEKSNDLIEKLLSQAKFITQKNSQFVQIHRHGPNLPHGDQILEALESAHLDPNHLEDLDRGSQEGAIQYLRMLDWAMKRSE